MVHFFWPTLYMQPHTDTHRENQTVTAVTDRQSIRARQHQLYTLASTLYSRQRTHRHDINQTLNCCLDPARPHTYSRQARAQHNGQSVIETLHRETHCSSSKIKCQSNTSPQCPVIFSHTRPQLLKISVHWWLWVGHSLHTFHTG